MSSYLWNELVDFRYCLSIFLQTKRRKYHWTIVLGKQKDLNDNFSIILPKQKGVSDNISRSKTLLLENIMPHNRIWSIYRDIEKNTWNNETFTKICDKMHFVLFFNFNFQSVTCVFLPKDSRGVSENRVDKVVNIALTQLGRIQIDWLPECTFTKDKIV